MSRNKNVGTEIKNLMAALKADWPLLKRALMRYETQGNYLRR